MPYEETSETRQLQQFNNHNHQLLSRSWRLGFKEGFGLSKEYRQALIENVTFIRIAAEDSLHFYLFPEVANK